MADASSAEETIFEQIAIDRVADAVVDQIEQLIVSGVLRPGQKLPPERELSEALGVSRPKLREAFRTLGSRGLVEIRRSEGAFINSLTNSALSNAMIDLFARHRSALLDFLEYRREQESFAAHLAAQRATETDHEILRSLIDDMETAHQTEDFSTEAETDLRFHMAVIEASHNAMMVHVMRSIYALMARGVLYNREFLVGRAGTRHEIMEQHRAICDAVIAGDCSAAAAASEYHLDYIERAYRTADDEDRRRSVARKRRQVGPALPRFTRSRSGSRT
ncbi:MAG: FadR/GntR family transcriptional regulator [Pseudomonadota bacterium]